MNGLVATWQAMQEALVHFTPDDFVQTVTGERKGSTFAYQRGWVVWHVIEHDPAPRTTVASWAIHWAYTASRHQTCKAFTWASLV